MIESTLPADTKLENKTEDVLFEELSHLIRGLGFELVHLEVQNHRQKTLRVFIDREGGLPVSIDDCVIVTKGLDEPLENSPSLQKIFKDSAYELEVSSPGLDRPLRRPQDFQKFLGREARVHTFRPLNADEISNSDYQAKNPKQKNFTGLISGVRGEIPQSLRITLRVGVDEITIPFTLISKAHLEPKIEF
jgi:ribosome maturation factor RimP